MSLTVAAFMLLYVALAVACIIRHPVYGIIGYYITYILSPAARWWGEPLAAMGFRYSFIMAFIAAVGLGLYAAREKTSKSISRQEVFLWLLVGIVWLAGFFTPPLAGGEDQAVKLTKTALMIFILKRSVTDLPKFRWLIWALVLASFYGALDTRLMADRIGSRIQAGSGGSDFLEGNFLAAHLAMMLPFAAMLFLRSRWPVRIFLAAASAVIVDAIIQCRSRGAFLAIAAGVLVALPFAPSRTRKAIFALTLVGALGGFLLIDKGFMDRMATINPGLDVEEQDASSGGRILAWKAAISMAADNPLGVGYNNFKPLLENYAPSIPGMDTHNTYLRCLAELGFQGFALLLLLIGNSLWQSHRLRRQLAATSRDHEYALWSYTIGVGLAIYLVAGMFISTTYIEEFYVILLLPDVLSALYASSRKPVQEENLALSAEGARP
ncbi:MAG: O-antigen ligase family protein [Acidobacteriota bacterium]|jgi:probable O-glycosylation ligase (exosortase A-associated)|nr:O-antigen ligase family protein [Acidobacteriota bacterium]NLT33773.1 hypothetical protein [Acidobacteriota bacterium]